MHGFLWKTHAGVNEMQFAYHLEPIMSDCIQMLKSCPMRDP